ncbi:unnamed protein product [Diamesa hyperborea]
MKCFNYVCFDPMYKENNAETKREKIWRILRNIYLWLIVVNFGYSIFGMLIAITLTAIRLDMKIVTSTAPNCLFKIIFGVRLISIWLHQKDFQHIVNTLMDLFPVSHEDQVKYKIGKYLKNFCNLKRIYAGSVITVAVLFGLTPILEFFKTGIWINTLPYNDWYPFDPYCPEFYTVLLLWQYWMSLTIAIVVIGLELILYGLITLTAMQFDILKVDLSEFKNTASNCGLENMKKLVDRQNFLIGLCDKLEIIFSPSIFTFVAGFSCIMSLLCFQLSVNFEIMHFLKYGSQLFTSLLGMWLLFHYGQSLIDSSSSLADGIYESEWFESENPQIKNGIILIILRAQKHSKLTSKFLTISLYHFGSVSMKPT